MKVISVMTIAKPEKMAPMTK
jgi:hypothetical protein